MKRSSGLKRPLASSSRSQIARSESRTVGNVFACASSSGRLVSRELSNRRGSLPHDEDYKICQFFTEHETSVDYVPVLWLILLG